LLGKGAADETVTLSGTSKGQHDEQTTSLNRRHQHSPDCTCGAPGHLGVDGRHPLAVDPSPSRYQATPAALWFDMKNRSSRIPLDLMPIGALIVWVLIRSLT
jgi:hypothetical protein